MSEKITRVIMKRTTAANRIAETYDLGVKLSTDSTVKAEFSFRATLMDGVYEDFSMLHNQIIGLLSDEADFKAHDKIRADVDKKYYGLKAIYGNLVGTDVLNTTISANKTTPKLPKISIPIFEGDYLLWPSFIGLFNNLIHTNDSLSNIEKFQYLLTSLSKEPLSLIKTITLADDNYKTAYETLVKRYQNVRLLATSYYQAMINSSVCTKGTYTELRKLVNTFDQNISALTALKFPTDRWDFILFNMMLDKIDSKTKTEFEVQFSNVDVPKYTDLLKFLESRCKALESVDIQSSKASKNVFLERKPKSSFVTTNEARADILSHPNCKLCNGQHFLYKCHVFLAKPPFERLNYVKCNGVCNNCLSTTHTVKKCKSKYRCRLCNSLHHSLLHLNNSGSNSQNQGSNDNANSDKSLSQLSAHAGADRAFHNTSTVMLSTAEVEIQDHQDNFKKIRVLLDSGSMVNFITEDCLNKLCLRRLPFSVPIEGISNVTTSCNQGVTTCTIKPCDKDHPRFSFDAVILKTICSTQPKVNLNVREWSHVDHLKLADSKCHIPGPVDVLLGAEIVPYILGSNRIFGSSDQPVAIESIFGWVLQGRAIGKSRKSSGALTVGHASAVLNKSLQRFWELEEIPQVKQFPEDKACEEIFSATVKRDDTGRFIVALPFKASPFELGDTYSTALRRFIMLEHRLQRNRDLQEMYSDFMLDYINTKHMSEIPHHNLRSSSAYYIPHHCVLKNESTTTKLRVVFDASTRGSNNLSLNDVLYTGQKLQKDISVILQSFRCFPVVFTCDIQQMYRQILLTPEHRDFQRILWRFTPNENLKEYCLNTVTYGVSSSPFLALRTLLELANLEASKYPNAAKVIKNHVYIDDCVTGAKNIEDALQLKDELIKLLSCGGFYLRKWASNHPKILESIPKKDIQMTVNFEDENLPFVKVLGLKWDPYADCFSYTCDPTDKICTKRNILSEISRLYDPMGFLSPVIFFAKLILQKLWLSKTDWDEDPPLSILSNWNDFKTQLPSLSSISIPRFILADSISEVQIHAFCDASISGYACVLYLRILTSSNEVKVSLICAKSKIAPLKCISLPRLELCAAVLLSNLVHSVYTTIQEHYLISHVYAWSDSRVALCWIKSSPHRWKTFVSNRVSHIQEKMSNFVHSWHHVPSSDNPADCASRGLLPKQLYRHNLWWSGPEWLTLFYEYWPRKEDIDKGHVVLCEEEERKSALLVEPKLNLIDMLFSKYSSLNKLERVISYVFRFIKKHKEVYDSAVILPSELDRVHLYLIKFVQEQTFPDVITCLQNGKILPRQFRKLSLFLDTEGLLRVGGRLANASISYDAKHPLLLPNSHTLTDLIISRAHSRNLHVGYQTLQYLLLQRYWILSPRRAIYRCLSKCLRCFKTKPQPRFPKMADLPQYRVVQLKAFSTICLDFCGPFLTYFKRTRGTKPSKSYVCIFVCCATKCIHLELVSDLTSEAFIAAFRRFVARRGMCTDIHSDQGTNFIGANRQIQDLIADSDIKTSFRWHFNPPGSPHFNGLAEAGVKSVKTHLNRVVGEQILTYEEFNTLLVQIEALLNSRPLCPISSDPNDLQPLTPGHFLVLEPLESPLPAEDFDYTKINRLNRWQLIQHMTSEYWRRWKQEYLHTLQQRNKWQSPAQNVKPNDLVLIKNELTPPLRWPLARVIKIHPGHDGIVRVATIKTQTGVYKRPVVKLCPLPQD